MSVYAIAYMSEDGRLLHKARHIPTAERPDHPLKGDKVDLGGTDWQVKEIRLFRNTGSAIAIVVQANDG